MKKQVLVLLVIVILVSTTIQAAIPYKESLEINNYNINSVQCSDNKLRVLVESKAEANLKILFKVYSSKGNINVFSDKLLKRLSADWFIIDTNLLCSDLLRLEVNGYAPINDNENVVYMNTESSYQFNGNELLIPQNIITPSSVEIITSAYPSYSYVYFNGKLIESTRQDNGQETYYAQDQIGSNVVLTDSSGNIIAKNEYDPFGRDVSNNKGEFKFTGKPQDSNGLYYYGARYYDSITGRFTQVDPMFNPSESSYAYADNNPLIKNDPTGKASALQDTTGNAMLQRYDKMVQQIQTRNEQEYNYQTESKMNDLMMGPANLGMIYASKWSPARWVYTAVAGLNAYKALEWEPSRADSIEARETAKSQVNPSSNNYNKELKKQTRKELNTKKMNHAMGPLIIAGLLFLTGVRDMQISEGPRPWEQTLGPAKIQPALEPTGAGVTSIGEVTYGNPTAIKLSNGQTVFETTRTTGTRTLTPEYTNANGAPISYTRIEPYLPGH